MNPHLLGHLANFLYALAYVVKDVLWLRLITIGGASASIVFNYFAPDKPLWVPIGWCVGFIIINTVHSAILIQERRGIKFTEDERDLYNEVFAELSPLAFIRILKAGEWWEYKKGDVLLRAGEHVDDLMLLYSGSALIKREDKGDLIIQEGAFIGEMAFTTGEPASATVVAATEMRVYRWDMDLLAKLFKKDPGLRSNFQSAINMDLAKKLKLRYETE